MDKKRVLLITGSHFVIDTYANYLLVLLPFLIPNLGLSLPMAGLLVAVQQLTSSIVQPLLGILADRFGTRLFSVFGLAAAAVAGPTFGIAPSYAVLLGLVALSGLGIASFHPQSAAMVSAISGKQRGTIMSIYIGAGNAGFALGPVIAASIVATLGLHFTPLMAAPGLVAALLMGLYAPRNWFQKRPESPSLRRAIRVNSSMLAQLFGVSTFRSVTHTALIVFLPLLFTERGFPPTIWASLLTFMLLSGVLGGLAAGYISDRIGRRWVIVASLALAVPFTLALLRLDGVYLWIAAGLAGATLLGPMPVLTVKAQETMPDNVGMASGLMLGFTIGVGGLSMGPTSLLAERIGILGTLELLAFLPILGALVAVSLVDQPRVRRAVTVQGQGGG